MSRSTKRFPNRKTVVDTGALLTALVLNFVRMIQAPEHKRQEILNKAIAPYLRQNPSLRNAYFARFSREIRPLRTTAHVIAEIHGLAKAKSRLNLHAQDLSSFWRHSMNFLLANEVDESLVRLVELKDLNEIVFELGPSDTAIIHLAHIEGAHLLTTDGRLAGRAREQGVVVMSDYEFACGQ